MQYALGSLAAFSPDVTSVMHGSHVANSAHYAGKAVDVGAIEGTAVGWNKPTWDAIVYAIMSRRFDKIGTIAPLVSNPQLQALARMYGVTLFEDEGSGPHIHFQVP